MIQAWMGQSDSIVGLGLFWLFTLLSAVLLSLLWEGVLALLHGRELAVTGLSSVSGTLGLCVLVDVCFVVPMCCSG